MVVASCKQRGKGEVACSAWRMSIEGKGKRGNHERSNRDAIQGDLQTPGINSISDFGYLPAGMRLQPPRAYRRLQSHRCDQNYVTTYNTVLLPLEPLNDMASEIPSSSRTPRTCCLAWPGPIVIPHAGLSPHLLPSLARSPVPINMTLST